MEVHFTPEQEAQLLQIADGRGKNAEQLVKDAALQVLEDARSFQAAVEKGIEQADRGEFLSHEEVVSRIESLLHR